MNETIWTVSTHDGHLELPSDTEVFTARTKAIDYLISKIEMAGSRGWEMITSEGSDGTMVIKYFQGSNLMQVSIMKCHEIKITD